MGWVRVEKPREILGFQDGKTVAVLDLQVATAADLPEIGGVVENYIIAAGSIAQIVEAEEPTWVTLSGDSEEWWPDQSGEDEGGGREPETLNVSPLSLGRSDSYLRPFPDIEPQETEAEAEPTEEGGEEDAELL